MLIAKGASLATQNDNGYVLQFSNSIIAKRTNKLSKGSSWYFAKIIPVIIWPT